MREIRDLLKKKSETKSLFRRRQKPEKKTRAAKHLSHSSSSISLSPVDFSFARRFLFRPSLSPSLPSPSPPPSRVHHPKWPAATTPKASGRPPGAGTPTPGTGGAGRRSSWPGWPSPRSRSSRRRRGSRRATPPRPGRSRPGGGPTCRRRGSGPAGRRAWRSR